MKATAQAETKTAAQKESSKKQDTSATETQSQNDRKPLLETFFHNMLKDIYWAEQHLIEKLPVLMEAATTEELRDAFEDHLYATQKHKSRLEKVFKMCGCTPEAKPCAAMQGLVQEAESIIKETKDNTMTRDAALIIAAQKVEHYEIASYGSLVQIARTIGYEDAADLLEQTLWEEEDTDLLLTDIAETSVNPLADEETPDESDNNDK